MDGKALFWKYKNSDVWYIEVLQQNLRKDGHVQMRWVITVELTGHGESFETLTNVETSGQDVLLEENPCRVFPPLTNIVRRKKKGIDCSTVKL